eukprot:3646065-Pyramimonas_sp.AAC.1
MEVSPILVKQDGQRCVGTSIRHLCHRSCISSVPELFESVPKLHLYMYGQLAADVSGQLASS